MAKDKLNSELEQAIPQENKTSQPEEFGGYQGKEPTCYGDWQHKGRVSDF